MAVLSLRKRLKRAEKRGFIKCLKEYAKPMEKMLLSELGDAQRSLSIAHATLDAERREHGEIYNRYTSETTDLRQQVTALRKELEKRGRWKWAFRRLRAILRRREEP